MASKSTSTAKNSKAASSAALNTKPNAVTIASAIKIALKVCAETSGSKSSHAQVLDTVAQRLGFANFRALKAVESGAIAKQVQTHPLLAAWADFQAAHPGLNMELSVSFDSSEGDDLPPFNFVFDERNLQSIVALENGSKKVKTTLSACAGSLPVGRGGTEVTLQVIHLDGATWIAFGSTTYHKYSEDVSGSLGDLNLQDLIDALSDAKNIDFSKVAIGEYAVVNEVCMAYRVDASTIRIACEFTNTQDYGNYPLLEDCITLKGYVADAPEEECLEDFLGDVVQSGVLEAEHFNEDSRD